MSQFTRRTSTLAGADFTQALHPETHAPLEGDEACVPILCRLACRVKGYKRGACVRRRRGVIHYLGCRCYR